MTGTRMLKSLLVTTKVGTHTSSPSDAMLTSMNPRCDTTWPPAPSTCNESSACSGYLFSSLLSYSCWLTVVTMDPVSTSAMHLSPPMRMVASLRFPTRSHDAAASQVIALPEGIDLLRDLKLNLPAASLRSPSKALARLTEVVGNPSRYALPVYNGNRRVSFRDDIRTQRDPSADRHCIMSFPCCAVDPPFSFPLRASSTLRQLPPVSLLQLVASSGCLSSSR